jgi:hypothetical protein
VAGAAISSINAGYILIKGEQWSFVQIYPGSVTIANAGIARILNP